MPEFPIKHKQVNHRCQHYTWPRTSVSNLDQAFTNIVNPHMQFTIEGVTATRCFSHFFIISRNTQKHKIWQFSNYVDFSCINEQDMFENSEFRRFCNGFTALSEKFFFSDFVSATRDLRPNFIKLKIRYRKFMTVNQY